MVKFHQNRTRNKLFIAITKILQKTLKGSNFATKLNFQKIIAPQVVILFALNVVQICTCIIPTPCILHLLIKQIPIKKLYKKIFT